MAVHLKCGGRRTRKVQRHFKMRKRKQNPQRGLPCDRSQIPQFYFETVLSRPSLCGKKSVCQWRSQLVGAFQACFYLELIVLTNVLISLVAETLMRGLISLWYLHCKPGSLPAACLNWALSKGAQSFGKRKKREREKDCWWLTPLKLGILHTVEKVWKLQFTIL